MQQSNWWSYRWLHALGNGDIPSDPQLRYVPYYYSIVPLPQQHPPHLQVGSEFYSEQLLKNSDFIITAFHLAINLLFNFHKPHFHTTHQSYKPYLIIYCFWHDCPTYLDSITTYFINISLLSIWREESLDCFHHLLDSFFIYWYTPITPYLVPQNLYPTHPTSSWITPPLYLS